MFNSILLKDQAFYFSKLIYRDTEIETYHRSGVALGTELYDGMLKIVDKNVRKVLRCHHILLAVQTEEDIDAQLRQMSSSKRNEFRSYAMAFNYLSKCKCNWDPPERIELQLNPKNLAKFILDGHFKECCEKHCVLTDPVMCYINKDIYNRIYTLMCENLLQ